jgi:hypothetical protein
MARRTHDDASWSLWEREGRERYLDHRNGSCGKDCAYCLSKARQEARPRRPGRQDRLPYASHYSWLDLEEIPLDVLLESLKDQETPAETVDHIKNELKERLNVLATWARETYGEHSLHQDEDT